MPRQPRLRVAHSAHGALVVARRWRWAMTDSGSGPVDVFVEQGLNGGREDDDGGQ